MIVLELKFEATVERLDARPAHRDVLERLKGAGTLVAAGPWSDDSGALLVFDTDEAMLSTIIDEDAYYSVHGVSIVSIREWSPIVGP